jgi:NTP pyrophosphatase (non-canonical NTP hydrolase)
MSLTRNENRFKDIVQWAIDRNIIAGATSHSQMVKLMEEIGELARGIARNNKEAITDSIGDSVVVLTILAAQYGLTIEDCVDKAYNEIRDRKGKMVNGVFIKEGDKANE